MALRAATRILLLGVLILMTLSLAGIASAMCIPHNNDPDRTGGGDYQAGWQVGPSVGETCLNGSYADITVKNPYSPHSVVAYTMINGYNPKIWAQIGWYDISTAGVLRHFYQYYTTSVPTAITKYPSNVPLPTVGESIEYKVNFDNGSFHFFIRGTNVANVTGQVFGGCYATQAGEIQAFSDQMPGEVNSHEQFTASHVRERSDNGWFQSYLWDSYAYTVPGGVDKSQYFGHTPSGWPFSTIEIWDKDCTG